MPVSKTKVVKEETIVEKPKEEEKQEFNETVYDIISEVHHKMDLMLEKIEAISEKPKSRTSNLNTEASYTNKRNAYIKKLNDGAILQPKPETIEYYKVVKEGDKYV